MSWQKKQSSIEIRCNRNLLSSVVKISFEKAMLKKIPIHSTSETLNQVLLPLVAHTLQPEDIEEDLQSKGLQED